MQRTRVGQSQGDALAPLDLTRLLRPYENQWVALSVDASEVLGAGPTLGDAKRAAEKTRKPHHFLHVLPFDVSYAPTGG